PHEKYGAGYKHICKGIPVGYYDNNNNNNGEDCPPIPVILHEPLGGPKAVYMSKENDPNYKKKETKKKKKKDSKSKTNMASSDGDGNTNSGKTKNQPDPKSTGPKIDEC
ncbi:MAG: hypothetical protein SGILL_005454, partial [Bacillariaceae sp.]